MANLSYRCGPLLLILAVVIPSKSDAAIRVYAVDLYGNAVKHVDVRVRDSDGKVYPSDVNLTDDNGIASLPVKPSNEYGAAQIRVNMQESASANQIGRYIGRIKDVVWLTKSQIEEGLAVPLWKPGDVKSLADAVITNPTHYAVAVQFPRTPGAGSSIVAEFDSNIDWWLSNVAADLPRVEKPVLARALYSDLEPGELIPARFEAQMRDVYAEVQRQNAAARICRRFPQGVPPVPNQSVPSVPQPTIPSPTFPQVPIPTRPIPDFPDPSWPLTGQVVIFNPGPCEFMVVVNNQPIRVRRGGPTSIRARVAPVTTAIMGQHDPPSRWNHWMAKHGSYFLPLHTHMIGEGQIADAYPQNYVVSRYGTRSEVATPRCIVRLSRWPQSTARPLLNGENVFGDLLRSLFRRRPAARQPQPGPGYETSTMLLQQVQ